MTVTIKPTTPGRGTDSDAHGDSESQRSPRRNRREAHAEHISQRPLRPVTPPPAARPLPVGFLRTPPRVIRLAAKMVDRRPEILIQLDQGIVPELALEKDRYTVEHIGA